MNHKVIEDYLKEEIHTFEEFFQSIGFKRIDGSVFGLLVFSNIALTSDVIQSTLGLSQSAVSQSLKTLSHYGAIEIAYDNETRKKHYNAKEDSLAVVATVFRKREQENIERLRLMAERIIRKEEAADSPRFRRLKSIIITSEIAESVMNFVIGISQKQGSINYQNIVKALPKTLEMLTNIKESGETLNELSGHLAGKLGSAFITGIKTFRGEQGLKR